MIGTKLTCIPLQVQCEFWEKKTTNNEAKKKQMDYKAMSRRPRVILYTVGTIVNYFNFKNSLKAIIHLR